VIAFAIVAGFPGYLAALIALAAGAMMFSLSAGYSRLRLTYILAR
jgi:hypothetical protein